MHPPHHSNVNSPASPVANDFTAGLGPAGTGSDLSPARKWRRWLIPALAVLIVLLALLLRVDAFVGRYGHRPRPAWTHVLDGAARVGAALRPRSVKWTPVAVPYVGGDPINYLRFAREMTNFYQAHVREPVFLALAKGWLWIFSDADVGLSAASAFASTLVVLATILLGSTFGSPAVGLVAGLLMAIEIEAIRWSVGGWRDDTFALFVTLTAWQLVRLQQRPTYDHALTAGVAGAAACLTRITSITFLVPGLVWILVEAARTERRQAARAVGLAAAVTAILVAPYLIACAREVRRPAVHGELPHAVLSRRRRTAERRVGQCGIVQFGRSW